jgi:two-component system phosphate regulon response regulator PhoB
MTHTVLTIEDQPDIRRLIRMTLEYDGLTVLEASDGEEGLKLARQHLPDVILLDVMMPGMDGLTVNRTLSVDSRLKHIPVVILSALGRTADIQAGLETGVHAYLVKPFSPWELLDVIQKLTGKEAVSAEPGGLGGHA